MLFGMCYGVHEHLPKAPGIKDQEVVEPVRGES
jgi:hypothetical protein